MAHIERLRRLAFKIETKRAERDRAPLRSNRRTILDKELQRLVTEQMRIETLYARRKSA